MILKHKRFAKFKKGILIGSFLFLAMFNFLVFWVYINFDTIRLTFYSYTHTEGYFFVGFTNYVETFKKIFLKEDMELYKGFLHSFHAIAINIIILPISVIVAYAFYKKIPGTTFFRVIFYLPSIISMVVLTTAYREMFGSASPGPISIFLKWFGIRSPQGTQYYNWLYFQEDSKTFWPLVYIFCIFNGLGTNVILMSSAMQRIPTEIGEAARLDGVSFFGELRKICLPLIMPTIMTWFILIFTSTFGFLMQPMLIAGDGNMNSMTVTTAWQIFANAQDPWAYGRLTQMATLGIVLSIVILPFTLITRAILGKYTTEVSY